MAEDRANAPGLGDATAAPSLRAQDPNATIRPPTPDSEATVHPTHPPSGTNPPSSVPPSGGDRPIRDEGPRELSSTGGRYQLLEVLGQGGMGVVHRALQPGLEREVAVKRSLGANFAQFLAEARITSRLDHPNIVPIYDLITTPEGEVALAMKRVRGTSWKDLIHPRPGEGGRDLEFHLGVLMSVANAVAFAHSKQVVHADLKPENVMVGEFGEVLVMDWGIALDVAETPTPGSPIPHRSRLLGPCGTPSYMPAELALGEGASVGPWSDTYLLGSILYELVSDAPPHRRHSLHETLVAAASGVVAPLPDSVPEGLRRLITRALSSSIQDRFADAAQFREALGDYLRSRESSKLSIEANRQFAQARPSPGTAEGDRARVYFQLAEAGAGFRQALVLWPANAAATKGAHDTSVMLAEQAIAHGDLGLAGSELERLRGTPSFEHLSQSLTTARETRSRAERSASTAKRTVKGLTVAVIAILGLGLWAVRGEARLAETRLSQVRRLADVKHLTDYRAEAERLWPAREERVPDLELWLTNARQLVAGLGPHRALLDELRAEAQAEPDGGFLFSADSDQWEHDTLANLIAGLETFAARDIPEMEQRLHFAQTVRQRSLDDHRADWERALAAIANRSATPVYGGLKLAAQMGLVPLGPDPMSGLWEFAHLESGEVPQRGPDGRLQINAQSGIVLVLVPPGRFAMGVEPVGPNRPLGSPNTDPQARPAEGPVNAVELGAFFLSKYEMTQAQWLRATGTNPAAYQAGQVVGEKTLTLLNPVEQISWADTDRVLRNWALNLPTEAQWEYALRGGTSTVYWEGSSVADLQGTANLADRYCRDHGGPASWVFEDALDDGWVTHAPVGSFRPNPYGLHDMQGNVWEWCQDRYGPYTLPVAPLTGERQAPLDAPRIFRGGGFRSSGVHARSGDRYSLYYNGSKAFDVGVRPARAIEP